MGNILNKPFKGIIPPMITPLHDNNTLDVLGIERLVERMVQGRVNGIFILGTSGEAQSLSYALRRELIEHTSFFINGRVPLLVGITDTSAPESYTLAKIAQENRASALVAAPPYYYSPGQPELIEYYAHLTKQIELPLFLYNMPSHTKVYIDPKTAKTLSENPNIIGLKDSSLNGVYFQSLLYEFRERPDFTLIVGPEEMLAETVLMGGHGGVNGGANLFPELYVQLYNAAINKDFDKIKILQQKIMQISTTIYNVGRHASSLIKGIKCALSLLGVCNDFMAEPFHRFREEERNLVKKYLLNLDLGLPQYDKEIQSLKEKYYTQ